MTNISEMNPVLANLAAQIVLDYFNYQRDRKRRIEAGTPSKEIGAEHPLSDWVHTWVERWAETYGILETIDLPE